MDDKELLTLAAKAAGLLDRAEWFEHEQCYCIDGNAWEPLTDDADAFRLQVKLRIKARYNEALGQALAWMDDLEATANIESCQRDECSAMRRAITLVAAGMGEVVTQAAPIRTLPHWASARGQCKDESHCCCAAMTPAGREKCSRWSFRPGVPR